MSRRNKNIEQFFPRSLLRAVKAAASSGVRRKTRDETAGEQDPDWYDASFEEADHWRSHYSESPYYFLWTVIADRVLRARARSVIEIGCGPGQLACLLRDKGIASYHGLDFSPRRIEQARGVCPEFAFSIADVFQTDLLNSCDYDTAICTEVLEHVEGDLELLRRIRSGTRFYGTVPNFPYTSHVRHFTSEAEVLARYKECFTELRVDAFFANAAGKTFYVLDGEIR